MQFQISKTIYYQTRFVHHITIKEKEAKKQRPTQMTYVTKNYTGKEDWL
jgi:hypothetical protein